MPAYIINDMAITDPQGFEEYKKLSPATVTAYGGRFLARGGEMEYVEGDWQPRRLVVLEFPSMDQAKAWLESPEYAHARRLRQISAKSRMVIVDGIASS
ncbi:MAG: DUF1330 domain-containing protein [Hylemonella sp.]|jgi:uncharacterized protein (DUF1330 family)